MFEDLYEHSVRYDDNLLQAACVVQAEFDLEPGYTITDEIRLFIRAMAEEYRVDRRTLAKRLREIVED